MRCDVLSWVRIPPVSRKAPGLAETRAQGRFTSSSRPLALVDVVRHGDVLNHPILNEPGTHRAVEGKTGATDRCDVAADRGHYERDLLIDSRPRLRRGLHPG
jgi:hypothetical protein